MYEGHPVDLVASTDERVPAAGRRTRPPLRMYHWRLETISSGLSPLLVELHRMRDGTGFAVHLARFGEDHDDLLLGVLGDLLPREPVVGGSRPASLVIALGGLGGELARRGRSRCGPEGRARATR